MSFYNQITALFRGSKTQPAETLPAQIESPPQELKVLSIQQTALTENKAETKLEERTIKALDSPNIAREGVSDAHERALAAIRAENIFSSECQKERAVQMASLAGLMYKELKEMRDLDPFFPKGLLLLPSPADLNIDLPKGLRVQAFRHGEEVIVAIRGTELNQDAATLFANLIADLGIGRHKTNEELIESVRKVSSLIRKTYGYELSPQLLDAFELIVKGRVMGDSDGERIMSYGLDILKEALKGGAIGGGIFGSIGAAGGVVLTTAGIASNPVGWALALLLAVSGGSLGFGFGSIKKAVTKGCTIGDGYPTLLSYIKALDEYILALKPRFIRPTDTVVTTGHSLAGFLSGVIGSLHADEAYSFNGPGVVLARDVMHIMGNLRMQRPLSSIFEYHSILMEGDFIGNLGRRDGGVRKLYLPLTLGEGQSCFPPCEYTGPLAHHGIELMRSLLKNSTVHSLPKQIKICLLPPPQTDSPKIEEIDD